MKVICINGFNGKFSKDGVIEGKEYEGTFGPIQEGRLGVWIIEGIRGTVYPEYMFEDADRVVTFSRDSKAINEGFAFEIPKSAGKKVKVLMTDLAEGKWTISNARRKVVTTEDVKADSGVLYFSAEPGKYSLTR